MELLGVMGKILPGTGDAPKLFFFAVVFDAQRFVTCKTICN